MSDGDSNLDRETYLRHQAIAILDNEKADAQAKVRSSHRKQAKAAGVELGDLDWTIKVMTWTVGEIASHFKRRLAMLGFNGINIKGAAGLVGDHTEDQTYAGSIAGMQGKAASPPANLTPNERETWLKGWHDGNKARDGAVFELKEAEEKVAKAAAEARAKPDESTAASQELGGEGYGDDPAAGAGDPPPAPEAAAADAKPPHQPKKRVKRTPEPA